MEKGGCRTLDFLMYDVLQIEDVLFHHVNFKLKENCTSFLQIF